MHRCACASAAPRLPAPVPHSATQSALPFKYRPPFPSLPRHLGKLSRLLMRSHMLMRSDVSGIPSFCPPPFSLCHFPLGADSAHRHSLVKAEQSSHRGRRADFRRQRGGRGLWVTELRVAGGRDPRSQKTCFRVQDHTRCLLFPAPILLSSLGWVLSG